MIATIKKSILIGALALCPFLVGTSFAQNGVTATLGQTGTGATTINILSNGTFSLDLNIVTTFNSTGITYFYQVSNNGSGLFQLTSRNTTGSPYPDPTTNNPFSNAAIATLQFSNDINNPPGNQHAVNRADLGATNDQFDPDDLAGSYFISTITFQALNAAPGQYFIFLDDRASVAGSGATDHPFGSNMITINVVPEPSTYALLALTAIGFAVVVYRRRRATAGC